MNHRDTLQAEVLWLREQASECYGTATKRGVADDYTDVAMWTALGDKYTKAAEHLLAALALLADASKGN